MEVLGKEFVLWWLFWFFGDGDGGIAHLYGLVLNSVGGKHREAVVIRKLLIVLAYHTFFGILRHNLL